jgi:hypothetical protein
MQARAVTPATSNSKDDSNSMTAHNSRNAATASMKATTTTATANTKETSAKAWMLGKVVNQQTGGRPTNRTYIRDTVNIRDDCSSRDANITV